MSKVVTAKRKPGRPKKAKVVESPEVRTGDAPGIVTLASPQEAVSPSDTFSEAARPGELNYDPLDNFIVRLDHTRRMSCKTGWERYVKANPNIARPGYAMSIREVFATYGADNLALSYLLSGVCLYGDLKNVRTLRILVARLLTASKTAVLRSADALSLPFEALAQAAKNSGFTYGGRKERKLHAVSAGLNAIDTAWRQEAVNGEWLRRYAKGLTDFITQTEAAKASLAFLTAFAELMSNDISVNNSAMDTASRVGLAFRCLWEPARREEGPSEAPPSPIREGWAPVHDPCALNLGCSFGSVFSSFLSRGANQGMLAGVQPAPALDSARLAILLTQFGK